MRRTMLLIGLIAFGVLTVSAGLSKGPGSAQPTHAATKNEASPKMKNVLLIGANGRTSAAIIPRLLEQPDVRLTLFLRRAGRLAHLQDQRVNLFEGDATNMDDLRRAVDGQDLVVSTMGGADLDVKTANIVHAMKEVGARRLSSSVPAASTTSCPSRSTPGINIWWARPVRSTSGRRKWWSARR